MKVKVKPIFNLSNIRYRVHQTFEKPERGMFITDIIVEFFVNIEDSEGEFEEVNVGTVYIQRIPSDIAEINRKLYGYDYDMATAMDDESQELYELYQDITEGTAEIACDALMALSLNDLCYIQNVKVEPKYRNCGIGTFMMKELEHIIQLVTRKEYPLMCLRPMPIELKRETEEWDIMRKKLIRWYQTIGFEGVNDDCTTMCYLK